MIRKISVKGSMRNKILLICIFCTLIALVLQTGFLLNVSSNMVYEQARDIAYNSLDNMQNELGSYVEGIENNMVNIYNDKTFLSALRDYGTAEELRQDYYRYARDYADEHFTASDGMMALYFYNSAHEIISVYRKAATPKRNYAADIYEEAKVDGANAVQRFFNVTIPMLAPAITICVVGITTGSLKVYDLLVSSTGGGPGRASTSVIQMIYATAISCDAHSDSVCVQGRRYR